MDNTQGKKRVLANAAIYSICAILTSAISFFMLPIYTRYMEPDQYGIVNIVMSFINVSSIILTLSVSNALLRFWSENKEKTKEYYSSLTWICTLFSILFIFITIPIKNWLSSLIFGNRNSYIPYLLFGLFALTASIPTTIYTGLMQAMQKAKLLSLLNFGRALLYVALNVYFIVQLRYQAYGMLLSLIISNAAMSIACLIIMLIRGQLTMQINIGSVMPLFRYSIPLIPHALSSNVANLVTKAVMSNSQSLSLTGMYSTALQMGMFMDIAQASINNAFRPWFNERISAPNSENEIKLMVKLLFSITCTMFIGISLFSQELLFIMTDEAYHSAWVFVPIIVFSNAVRYIYYTHMLTILYDVKLSRIAFVCSISGSLGNSLIDFILVPLLGGAGAAISLLISIILMSVLTVIISRKQSLIRFDIWMFIRKIIISLAVVIAGLTPTYVVFRDHLSIINMLFKTALIFVAMVILFWSERDSVKTYLGHFRTRFQKISE